MRSMTGYGRRSIARDGREMTVEIKTVNHRFLDLSCRLPRALSFAEDAVRKQMGLSLRRGHADVNVTYQNLRRDAREVRLDEGLVLQYKEALLSARLAWSSVSVSAVETPETSSTSSISSIGIPALRILMVVSLLCFRFTGLYAQRLLQKALSVPPSAGRFPVPPGCLRCTSPCISVFLPPAG